MNIITTHYKVIIVRLTAIGTQVKTISGFEKNYLIFYIVIFLLPFYTLSQDTTSEKETTLINTVNGTIDADNLGLVLSHEHIMSNFGSNVDSTSIYKEKELFEQVIPYLKKLKAVGVQSIFDCTTAYFGRRVDLLKKISDATGIHIITNTGIYGAANDRYIPPLAYEADLETLSKIWIEEFENGIDGTKIKPGFIKLAFDSGTPSEIDKKLFEAGIRTHLKTGLTLAVHTGNNKEAAQKQLALLEKYNVHPSAWVWVHANAFEDDAFLMEVAKKGAWISLDGVNKNESLLYLERIKRFRKKGILHKILLSHDGNGFPRGGEIRKFDAITQNLVPVLLSNGFTEKEVRQLLVENPKGAYGLIAPYN